MIKQFLVFILSFSCFFIFKMYGIDIPKQWQNMLYYEKHSKGLTSIANGTDFFITPNGKYNAIAEFNESVLLVKKQDSVFKQQFPLRYKFLCQYLNIAYKPLYHLNNNKPIKVFLAYPHRYLSSPTSMFGHLFLLMQVQNGPLDSDIIHFLADPSSGHPLLFVPNGLTGRFKGNFLTEDYYKRVKTYSYQDDRAISYYELKLSADQILDIQLHMIELKKTDFDYYFFNQNCAFFIGRMLDIAIQKDFTQKRFFVYPAQIINHLQNNHLLSSYYTRLPMNDHYSELHKSLSSMQKKQLKKLMFEDTDVSKQDTRVLNAFLQLSPYIINNQPHYAFSLRKKRLKSLQLLKKRGRSFTRQVFNQNFIPTRINDSAFDFSFMNDHQSNSYTFSYFPILFSKDINFSNLDANHLAFLSAHLHKQDNQGFLVSLGLWDISNKNFYNRITKKLSWHLQTTLHYQKNLYTSSYFSIGPSFLLSTDSVIHLHAGVNLSDYSTYHHQPFDTYYLQWKSLLGIKHYFKQIHVKSSFNLELIDDYLYSNLELAKKYNDFILFFNTYYGQSEEQFKLSVQYLF